MNLSSAPPFFSFHPHPRYPSQRCSSSTGKLCKYHPFSPHISGHFATNLRYVECAKQVLFDDATSIWFVEETFLHSTYLKEVAFSAFRMLFIDLLQQSYFSKLRWPHIYRRRNHISLVFYFIKHPLNPPIPTLPSSEPSSLS